MLVYSDYRALSHPLILRKRAEQEPHAELFAAYPAGETLYFTAELDRALMARSAFLVFVRDDDGAVFRVEMKASAPLPLTAWDRYTCRVALGELCTEAGDGLFYYRLEAETVYGRLYSHGSDTEEEATLSDSAEYTGAFQLLVYREEYTTPEYLGRGVMYQIFVDRFFRGGNAPPREDAVMAASWEAEISQYPDYPGAPVANNLFYGGDLDGVRLKLPYLRSLGVTVLYLCPIFEAASNHKYDTGDYMAVDAMFGGQEALLRLLRTADACGIRILLDGVFNHTGADSRYFNRFGRYEGKGAYQSQDSPYYAWYRFRHWPDAYDCWWGVTILPAVDSGNPDFMDFVAGEEGVVATYGRMGVSGFRLDVADELNPSLIRAIRERLHAIRPDAALIGEVWEDASNKMAYGRRRRYFRGHELDSVMNYPLKDAILGFLLHGGAEEFSRISRTLYAHYPRPTGRAMMNILGTHDTERVLTVLGGRDLRGLSYAEVRDIRLTEPEREVAIRRLCVGYTILSFLPGIPCIYYGDEAGMEGGRDPFNRRTYPWGQEEERILSHYRKIGRFRAQYGAFLSDAYYRVRYAEGDVLILERFRESMRLLLLVNRGDSSADIPLQGIWTDLLSGERIAQTVRLSAESFCLLAPASGNGNKG